LCLEKRVSYRRLRKEFGLDDESLKDQLHGDAGDAQDGGAVVADQPAREAIKIRAKVVSHGRYVTFQMAEVSVSRQMFANILSLITRLRPPPAPA
jgi:hypothetical protein